MTGSLGCVSYVLCEWNVFIELLCFSTGVTEIYNKTPKKSVSGFYCVLGVWLLILFLIFVSLYTNACKMSLIH